MDEQQDGIGRIVAADADPLLDASKVDGLQLVDPTGWDRLGLGNDRASRVFGGRRVLRERLG